jgi:SAM-dependent methyltransferase
MSSPERGTGPGPIAPDGSAVEFYASLPPDDASAALIHAAVPPGASILELGSGTGRMTHPLVAYGHPVVAVDHSAEMLAYVEGAETVHGRIEELALGRTFDVVLLASFVIHYADVVPRVMLDVCRAHVAETGRVILQRQPPERHDAAAPSSWEHDGIAFQITELERYADGGYAATMEYTHGGRVWTHSFTSRRIGDDDLTEMLAAARLRLDRFLDPDRGWVLARPIA